MFGPIVTNANYNSHRNGNVRYWIKAWKTTYLPFDNSCKSLLISPNATWRMFIPPLTYIKRNPN
jgi:hypothetical protein